MVVFNDNPARPQAKGVDQQCYQPKARDVICAELGACAPVRLDQRTRNLSAVDNDGVQWAQKFQRGYRCGDRLVVAHVAGQRGGRPASLAARCSGRVCRARQANDLCAVCRERFHGFDADRRIAFRHDNSLAAQIDTRHYVVGGRCPSVGISVLHVQSVALTICTSERTV